jgi:hypothetical protein
MITGIVAMAFYLQRVVSELEEAFCLLAYALPMSAINNGVRVGDTGSSWLVVLRGGRGSLLRACE